MQPVARTLLPVLPRQDTMAKSLTLEATDAPGPHGDNHAYRISGFTSKNNPSYVTDLSDESLVIYFQNGNPKELGVNGVTLEALMTVCKDRLEGCQQGSFASTENSQAIFHLRLAIKALQARPKP